MLDSLALSPSRLAEWHLLKEKASSLTREHWVKRGASCLFWASASKRSLLSVAQCRAGRAALPQAYSVAGSCAGPLGCWPQTILSAHEVPPGVSEPAQPGSSTNFPPLHRQLDGNHCGTLGPYLFALHVVFYLTCLTCLSSRGEVSPQVS